MFGRGRPGLAARRPNLAAAAEHGGGGHAAVHEGLRALLRHRAHRVHRRPVQAALQDGLGQPQALRGGHQPRDLLGGHGGDAGTQPAQAHEDGQALHQDRTALPRVQELQLHVRHHQVGGVTGSGANIPASVRTFPH